MVNENHLLSNQKLGVTPSPGTPSEPTRVTFSTAPAAPEPPPVGVASSSNHKDARKSVPKQPLKRPPPKTTSVATKAAASNQNSTQHTAQPKTLKGSVEKAKQQCQAARERYQNKRSATLKKCDSAEIRSKGQSDACFASWLARRHEHRAKVLKACWHLSHTGKQQLRSLWTLQSLRTQAQRAWANSESYASNATAHHRHFQQAQQNHTVSSKQLKQIQEEAEDAARVARKLELEAGRQRTDYHSKRSEAMKRKEDAERAASEATAHAHRAKQLEQQAEDAEMNAKELALQLRQLMSSARNSKGAASGGRTSLLNAIKKHKAQAAKSRGEAREARRKADQARRRRAAALRAAANLFDSAKLMIHKAVETHQRAGKLRETSVQHRRRASQLAMATKQLLQDIQQSSMMRDVARQLALKQRQFSEFYTAAAKELELKQQAQSTGADQRPLQVMHSSSETDSEMDRKTKALMKQLMSAVAHGVKKHRKAKKALRDQKKMARTLDWQAKFLHGMADAEASNPTQSRALEQEAKKLDKKAQAVRQGSTQH